LIRAEFGEFDVEEGTAYLIDSVQGYALTAAHVVYKSKSNQKPISVRARGRQFGKKKPLLTVVKSDITEGVDLALIRFQNPSFTKGLSPLEVEFSQPQEGESDYHSLAWGKFRKINDPRPRSAEPAQYLVNGQLLAIEHGAEKGDSGAPLIDPSGTVVATLVARASGESYYTLLNNGTQVIEAAEQKQAIDDLKEKVLPLGVDAIFTALIPDFGKYSNIHLVQWALDIESFPKKYRNFREKITCPIAPALGGRDLHPYKERIMVAL
jgi:hypothetical protein